MSIHLLIVASYLPEELVNARQKLVLQKIADSADDDTRLAVPTQRRLVAWAGVGPKRVSTLITELVGKGLVERVSEARDGHAAVYRVFPLGIPPIPDREALDERLTERLARPKNQALARVPEQPRRRPAAPARTASDVAGRTPAVPVPPEPEEPQVDQGSQTGTLEEEPRVPRREPAGFPEGNPQGSEMETPSFPGFLASPPSSSPPTPTADAAGEPGPAVEGIADGCGKHRGRPAANCRGCGTSARARRARAQADQAERARLLEAEQVRQRQRETAERQARRDSHEEEYEAAVAATRAALRSAKGRPGNGR
ncbi:helix-turn-helix domain-containing protein [Streptacidiphilus cavernicola]|uniref:Helix-turn-helix domain-containing protein n=1 Tax=Streptacidiphilus cavernicola TaxID=3342716 RepID=A0ABV6VNX8_9ACTN